MFKYIVRSIHSIISIAIQWTLWMYNCEIR